MPLPSKIELEEFEEVGVGRAATQIRPEQWEEIQVAWARSTRTRISKCFELGVGSIKPKNWIGTIAASRTVLEVVPRGAKGLSDRERTALSRNVDEMLRIGLTDRAIDLAEASLASGGSRFEPAVEMFADLTLDARHKKLIRTYRSTRETSRMLSGRLAFPAQALIELRRPGTFTGARVELHEDCHENRFLKSVALRLLPRVTGGVRRRLECVIADFDAVSDVSDVWSAYDGIRWDRLSADYREAIELGKSLLQGDVGGLLAGSLQSRSEIVYTPDLFETFVGRMTDSAARLHGLATHRKPSNTSLGSWLNGPRAGRNCFELFPDVELRRSSKPIAVIDAKWKWLDLSSATVGMDEADVYQVATYGARLGCRAVALIYPCLAESDPFDLAGGRLIQLAGSLAPLRVHVLAMPLLWSDSTRLREYFSTAIKELVN
jgi:5-methylcytosine-specific restriction endonuclease McrBC regulatory subunit McrC